MIALTNRIPPTPVKEGNLLQTLCACVAFSILIMLSPIRLFAQFQEPTPEELKMTEDPKAPGAAAVYLNIEEIASDPIHFQSFYARIKVLQEKGKELATVELPYLHGGEKIVEIKARTIHSDGAVIPLVGKPEDLLSVKFKDKGNDLQVNQKVFNLPSVEVGSILEYRYVLQYEHWLEPPRWKVQRPYFVHKAHFSFTPFEGFLHSSSQTGKINDMFDFPIDDHNRPLDHLIWWASLPPGVTVKNNGGGHYSLDIADVPPTPDEEWMPPVSSFLYKVEFYYLSDDSSKFWVDESKLWSKDIDHFAEPSKAIKEAVAGLITPTDNELDKAKKLYVAAQALDNTDYSRKKTESERKELKIKATKHAQDTWTQKSGTSEDIALLYLAMLRAAGLNANAMKVVNREQGIFDPSYLTLRQLDDTIVLLNSGGKEIALDPGEKMCPFQMLSWKHSLATGVRQSGGDNPTSTSPEQRYIDNKTVRTGDITLDAHGSISGNLTFTVTGQEALYWRQLALENDLDEVKKKFDHSLESEVPDGVEAHLDHFVGLDDPYVSLRAMVIIHGNLGAATSKRLLLPGFFFETRGGHPFVNQEKRLELVDMHYDNQISDQVVYHLPAGFTVEGSPQDTKIPWPNHAVYVTKAVAAPGQITIARQLTRAFTVAKPEEYNDLRNFYQKVAAADQGQLVLTTSPAAKGN